MLAFGISSLGVAILIPMFGLVFVGSVNPGRLLNGVASLMCCPVMLGVFLIALSLTLKREALK
jgi:hypothetical protein